MRARILAVCPNPALDRVALARGASRGGTVRASEVLDTPGGKGLHVALIARELGARVSVVVPLGGPTGLLVRELLHADGLRCTRIAIAANTRTTYTVVDPEAADVVEVIEPSPVLTEAEADALADEVSGRLRGAGVVTCSGSVPDGVDPSFYATLTERARAAGAAMVVDTSGASLVAALSAGPTLVAPNAVEAAALLGEPEATEPRELAHLGRLLIDRGARNALVTAGRDGSVLALESGDCWHFRAEADAIVNAVGCGDALVGGVAATLAAGGELTDAVAVGTAAAVDKLSRLHPGKVDAKSVKTLAKRVERRRLED